jgi:hypothetical protein
MSRSEIFDGFIKIAQEKGMISKDSDESKKKLERTQRADSLSISDIEALYGVKPDLPKNMEYERNIIENAHPNSVVVSPSYDKLNGLVENNNERQDIILHILNKTPDGLLTQRKYAEQELINTLISAANDLDNKNKDDLRKLADACLMQVCLKKNKQLKKKAALPAVAVAGLVAIPLAIGALWLQQNLSFANEGFERNHAKLIAELDDMISSSVSWGVGVKYKESLTSMVTDFKGKLISMYALFKKIEPIINQLEKPRTAEELVEISKQPKTTDAIKAFNLFHKAASNMLTYVQTIQTNFKSEEFKARQTEDKGFMQQLVDRTQILHGGMGMIADDFDDVNRAIPPYQKSIGQILKIFSDARSIVDKAKADLDRAQKEAPGMFGSEMADTTTPESAVAPTTEKPQLHKDLEDALNIPGLS